MTTTLNIRWDGDAPGLPEHVLSLGAWHEALGRLLRAVRRTASGMAHDALDDPEYGARGGRLNKLAGEIDLQIIGLREGCVNVAFRCVIPPQPGQQDLFLEELPRRAVDRVLEDIQQEAEGQLRNATVREFLKAIPAGITVQEYQLDVDGVLLRQVRVGQAHIAVPPPSTPGLRRLRARLSAACFEPGNTSITLKGELGTVRLSATPEQIEQALALRGQPLLVMSLSGPPPRVIWLSAEGAPPALPSGADRTALFTTRWARTLDRLA